MRELPADTNQYVAALALSSFHPLGFYTADFLSTRKISTHNVADIALRDTP